MRWPPGDPVDRALRPGCWVHLVGNSLGGAISVKVAATRPDLVLLILPGVGHVAQMETPDLVARAIIGLLDDVRANPPVAPPAPAFA
jgi:pimeloyl-ACP methyl ester carboxylesterase